MSTHSEVMHCYEQMAVITERMLVLARTDHWSGLPELEASYSGWIEHLKALNACGDSQTLDEAQRDRTRLLLTRIQGRHLAVCELVAPKVAHLKAVLRSLEWQTNLSSAYYQPGQPRHTLM